MLQEVSQATAHGTKFLHSKSGCKAEVRFELHSLKITYFLKKKGSMLILMTFSKIFFNSQKYACVGSPQQIKVSVNSIYFSELGRISLLCSNLSFLVILSWVLLSNHAGRKECIVGQRKKLEERSLNLDSSFGGSWRLDIFLLEETTLQVGVRKSTYLGCNHRETNGGDKLCSCQDCSVLSYLCPSSVCALQAIQHSASNKKALGFLHVGSMLSAVIHAELNIQREQRAIALLILFPRLQSPVVWSTQQSDTSKRWWPIVNNPVSSFSRQFSEKAVLWRRKGTGCYGIRLWDWGCGKQRPLCFQRMHGCKQEALQGTAESLGSVQDRGRNLLKQVVVTSLDLSRHSVFGFPEST